MELKHSKHIGPVNRAGEKKNREIERGGRGRGGGEEGEVTVLLCFIVPRQRGTVVSASDS